MSTNQFNAESKSRVTKEPQPRAGFQKLCNDSSMFHDFGHFMMNDPSYADGDVHFKPLPSSAVVFNLRLSDDVFDTYEYAVNL